MRDLHNDEAGFAKRSSPSSVVRSLVIDGNRIEISHFIRGWFGLQRLEFTKHLKDRHGDR